MDKAPIALAALLLLATWAQAPVVPPPTPGPMNPLSDAERQAALTVAGRDATVAATLEGERFATIGASLSFPVDKHAVLPRSAEVQFYRYARHDVVLATVDLGRLAVSAVRVEPFEPVLVLAELQAAKPVLLADPAIAARVAPALDVELLNAGLVATATGACSVNRCFETRFVHASGANLAALQPIPALVARFDLTRMAVDEVL